MNVGLKLSKAYEILAGDDERPLLILREFSTFDDPDNEKLSRKLYTEKTVILAHWFNCVRLPHHVVESDHPFHRVFQGDNPPQLLLASADGSSINAFDFKSSRDDLMKDMTGILGDFYVRNPAKEVSSLLKMLPKFDVLDKKIQDLKEDLDKAIEDKGPRSGKARKLQKELKRAEAERKVLEEKKEALRSIPLKPTIEKKS